MPLLDLFIERYFGDLCASPPKRSVWGTLSPLPDFWFKTANRAHVVFPSPRKEGISIASEEHHQCPSCTDGFLEDREQVGQLDRKLELGESCTPR